MQRHIYFSKVNRFRSLVMGMGIVLFCTSVNAQPKVERAAAYQSWSVFRDYSANEPTCWIATKPVESVMSKSNAKRGDVMLMILVLPKSGVKNEVSFVAGYPLKPNTPVSMSVGSAKFNMFVGGEGAWLGSAKEDAQTVTKMRQGAQAILKGVSTRGTKTKDIFSLYGFTKALSHARDLCSK